MKFFGRRIDQGQIVEVAYAYDHEGGAYKRVTDRSHPQDSPARVQRYYGALVWDREPSMRTYDRSARVHL